MDINFESYKVFYHAARTLSFSAAAKKLFITQSAVSQSIKNLETKLGVQLFLRKGRELKLTREGEWFYGYVQQAVNLFRLAEAELSELKTLEAGEVRIGASDTICRYFLLPHLQKFNLLYPKVKIQFINRTSSQIREILNRGLIDFGVVTLRPGETGDNIQELTIVEDVFVASSHRFPSLQNRTIELQELANLPILLLEKVSTSRQNLDGFLAEHGVKLAPEIELESMELLVEFAKIGFGVAHVLKESAKESLDARELFIVQTKTKLPPRKLGLITNPELPLSQAAQGFLDLLAAK